MGHEMEAGWDGHAGQPTGLETVVRSGVPLTLLLFFFSRSDSVVVLPHFHSPGMEWNIMLLVHTPLIQLVRVAVILSLL